MKLRAMVVVLGLLPAAAGCYSHHRPGEGDDDDAGGDAGTQLPDVGAWPDGGHWWPEGGPADVGPVCPDSGGSIEMWECDVLIQDCDPGEACYAWTEYTDDPCVREIYRSSCITPGAGGHGDPCDAGCQAGLECFITGEGTQCLFVCDILGGTRLCPPGMICLPTDLPGIGACD